MLHVIFTAAMAAPIVPPTVVTDGFNQVGTFNGGDLPEISGMAFSSTYDRAYAHNDSGNATSFFITKPNGTTLQQVKINGPAQIDYEDMSLGPCQAGTCLFIGDIGDNGFSRPTVLVSIIQEMEVFPAAVTPVKTIRMKYSDGQPHNCEALVVHPKTGDMFLLTKVSDNPHMYKVPASEISNAADGAVLTARDIGTIDLNALFPGADEVVTGMAVSPDGSRFSVLSYTYAYEFEFDLSHWLTVWTSQLLEVPRVHYKGPRLNQQEAIAYDSKGALFYTTEVNSASPAPFVRIPNKIPEPPPPAVGKPVMVTVPVISGRFNSGQTLSVTTGTWSGEVPITFKYQWKRCSILGTSCLNITGAKADTYVLADTDVQRTVRVRVTAKNPAGTAWVATTPKLVEEATTSTDFPPGTICNASGSAMAHPGILKNVVVIFFENRDASAVLGNSQAPYFNSIRAQCGSSTKFLDNVFPGADPPSLPHYLAWAAGSNCNIGLGVNGSGCIVDNSGPGSHRLNTLSIFNQVASRTYNEGMTRNCNWGDENGYRVKHNPEPYFTQASECGAHNIGVPSVRCSGTLNAACGNPSNAFTTDLANDTLAALSLIIPDNMNSMHDASVTVGDNWLRTYMPPIMGSPAYLRGEMAIYVLFDEDGGGGGDPIPNLVVSPYIQPTSSNTVMNLFATLRAIEIQLGIPPADFLGCASGTKPGGGACPEGSTADLRAIFNF